MTGLSHVRLDDASLSVDLTLRTFNSKSLDIKCRLPEELLMLDSELQALISQSLARGRVELSIKVKGALETMALPSFDEQKASHLLNQMLDFMKKNPCLGQELSMGDLLKTGLLVRQVEVAGNEEPVKELVFQGLKRALGQLQKVRRREAELLEPGLKENLLRSRSLLSSIEARADDDIKKRFAAVTARIKELFSTLSIGEDRIYQECAMLAERSDFREETERLSAHIEHFASICQESSPKGRRLDFLCQEMLRESSTLLTKAFEHAVMAIVIELKAEIERMREQVQNIE